MAKAANPKKITHATVRMYCMGTGDCFVIKFFADTEEKFKMMIDCGVWKRSADYVRPFIEDLKEYVDNRIDLLVITHEHSDHVSVFESCKDLFLNDFTVDKIWMGWSEDDSLSKIKKWKTQHGEKKVALAIAAERIDKAVNNPKFQEEMEKEQMGYRIMSAKKNFAEALKGFADLHVMAAEGTYKGFLAGMKIIKKEIAEDNIDYLYPGDIIDGIEGAEGIKFYVLGPPEKWETIEMEGGGEDESYTNNKILKGTDAFSASILSSKASLDIESILPFDQIYETDKSEIIDKYKNDKESWRNIDDDWLYSAGSLALRVNSLTNNLSLALAIEFEDSGRVMLFPGDAEYGSWSSWHEINWKGVKPKDENLHFTQDLLKRTVFYKVAHHMSHNGTAQRLGLNMMEHKDLAAMATLNYDSIAPNWKFTMPNREMLQELLEKTKGRVMIMKDSDLYYDFKGKEPLPEKIKDAQKKMNIKEKKEFTESFKREENNLYVEYTVKGN